MSMCGATLRHTHGTAVCDLPPGHDPEEQHSALCEACAEDDPEYGDPSDRLRWDEDGESWVAAAHQHVLVKDPLRLGWRCDVPGCGFFKAAGEFDGIRVPAGLEWVDEA